MSTLSTMVVKLVAETGAFVAGMESAASKAKDVAAVIGGAAAAGVAAMGAAMTASIAKSVEWGDTLDSLGDVLGTSADESAALAVAIRGVGGDVDGITGSMAKLIGNLKDQKGNWTDSAMALQEYGYEVMDANGKMLSTATILENVAREIDEYPDGLEKTQLMMERFGKSGKDLSDTMHAIANGGLQVALDKAKEFGLAIGEDGVNKSVAFKKSMADLQMMGDGLAVTFGNELLPTVIPLLQKFTEFAQKHMPEIKQAIGGVVSFVETSLIPLFEKMAPIMANPFFAAQKIIIQSMLIIESTFVDIVNNVIQGINQLNNDILRITGQAAEAGIPLLQKRQVSIGTNGGFAYGQGGAGEVTPPVTSGGTAMSVTINLAPGQTQAQGEAAADAFVRRARSQGLVIA